MSLKRLTCLAAALTLISPALAADRALHNIKGYSSTDDGLVKFSVLVFSDEGRVIAHGEESLLAAYPNAERIEGRGRTVLPGLIDAHAHVLGYGLLQSELNLAGVTSLDDAVARIGAYARKTARGQWILGRGWNQVLWPKREFPHAEDIDAVVSDRPVWLRRIDGHAAWANSAAMKIAGIDADTPDPIGGKIVRDADGRATGIFIDNAMGLIEAHAPKPDKAIMRQAISAASEALLSEGITSVHDTGIGLVNAEVYMSMADDDDLTVRIYAMIAGVGDVLDAIGEPIRGYGKDRLDIAAVKLVSDGALGSRGAAMIEPYSDDPENRGLPFWTQSELDAMVAKANAAWGHVDIMVNNAGVSHLPKPLEDVTEDEFDRVLNVNVRSIYLTARALVPQMKARKSGCFVQISSTAGVSPRPKLNWYNASKGWVNTATRTMAVELAPFGIRVNAVNPVAGETPLLPTFMGEDTPEMRAKFLSTIPIGRMSTPQDIANASLYLASDEASMVTGVCMLVDGGRCI